MQVVRLVAEEEMPLAPVATVYTSATKAWTYMGVTMILLAMVGTWLVWFSAFIQRHLQQEDIRGACQRVMPETADRCFDTVVIQRGGIRR
jgi:hypothetical protein